MITILMVISPFGYGNTSDIKPTFIKF